MRLDFCHYTTTRDIGLQLLVLHSELGGNAATTDGCRGCHDCNRDDGRRSCASTHSHLLLARCGPGDRHFVQLGKVLHTANSITVEESVSLVNSPANFLNLSLRFSLYSHIVLLVAGLCFVLCEGKFCQILREITSVTQSIPTSDFPTRADLGWTPEIPSLVVLLRLYL